MNKLYILAIVYACLALAACSSPPPEPCLGVNEPGRVMALQTSAYDNNRGSSQPYTTIKVQVADGSMRVCETWTEDTSVLKPGEVIRGHKGAPYGQFPYYRWQRIG